VALSFQKNERAFILWGYRWVPHPSRFLRRVGRDAFKFNRASPITHEKMALVP
jgi:hypothetical protein